MAALYQLIRGLLGSWLSALKYRYLPSLFDPDPYRRSCPAAASGITPLRHFLFLRGFRGRHPHPLFDAAFYLRHNPDVRAAGIDPLVHYVLHGAAEGRKPHALFQPDYYLRNCPEARESDVPPLVHFLQSSGNWADPHPLFHCRAWLLHNPDAAASGINPLLSYVLSESRSRAEGAQLGQTPRLAA